MASAKPVLATDVGGVRDLIQEGKNGFLVGTNNAGDFAEKLLRLMEDSELRVQLGRSGRDFVKERHSKDRLVNDIKKLYEECLDAQ